MTNEDAKTSIKHRLISKSNSRMFIILAAAGVVFSFSAVASYTLVKRMMYQNKVISERSKAEEQLKKDIKSADELADSFIEFDSATESVVGTADKNSKIILDALPSKYDFPALATSMEKLITESGLTNISIGGLDNEAAAEQTSTDPEPIEIPLTLSGTGNYDTAQKFIDSLHRSIRPFKISIINFSGSNSNMTVSVNGVTYYQPEKELDIKTVEVKQ